MVFNLIKGTMCIFENTQHWCHSIKKETIAASCTQLNKKCNYCIFWLQKTIRPEFKLKLWGL